MSPRTRSAAASSAPGSESGRRAAILESALTTFARYGYRKTSMDAVARAADVSRPGLYFLFDSKESLFRAAVTHSLGEDLAAIEAILDDDRTLPARLLDAFDRWAGRYVGPGLRDVEAVIDDNPDLLGPVVRTAPRRFEALTTSAIAAETDRARARRIAQTLVAVSAGAKHLARARPDYRRRLEVAIDLVLD